MEVNKLKNNVSEEILKKTTKCHNNFACLTGQGEKPCEIEYDVNGSLFFVNYNQKKTCQYALSFGYSYICTCPTRKELVKKQRS